MRAGLFITSKCINAEGPVWDEDTQTLYFIDVEAGNIFSYKESTLNKISVGEKIGTMALCKNSNRYIVGAQSGIYLLDPLTGEKTRLCDPESNLPENRFNDGKADPSGRFLAGTLSMVQYLKPRAALYSLSKETEVRKIIPDVGLANGLTWSADGSVLYFIDTDRHTVSRYDYDKETGDIANGRVIIKVPDFMGAPDGMTIDLEGCLWVALWGGKSVTRWDPKTGELIDRIEVPAQNVSSCCFGGKNMDELFITTASQDTDLKKYPLAGNVFIVRPGVAGSKTYKYDD